jgi:HAD superfamily hydrolase (TIGR01484 family)
MTKPVLICTDLDRTLIPNGHQPESPEARSLLRHIAKRDDVYLAYVSGRHKALLEEAIADWELPIPDYAIGDVGTTIYEIQSGNWHRWEAWQLEIGRDWHPYQHDDIADWLAHIEVLQLQEQAKQNDFKLSYYAPIDTPVTSLLDEINHSLADHPIHYNAIWSIDEVKQIGLLDILPQRADKLQAIRFLMQQHDFTVTDTVFSGDSGNDLEVLTSEIQATVVNNATREVKDQAIKLAQDNGYPDRLYVARGGFLDMNGNYAAGILEGLAHYIPRSKSWMLENSD